MRVALVFEFGTLSGGERSMLAVVEWLAQRRSGWRFVALAPRRGPLAEALAEAGVELRPFELRDVSGRKQPLDQAVDRLAGTVARCQVDLVHANSLSMARLLGRAAPALDVPAAGHIRDIVRLSRAAVHDVNQNRLLVAVSQATADFHAAQGVALSRLRVVYNGVDCDRFRPRPATGWLRRELGIPPDALLVGTVGQICLRKAQDVLAQAAVQVVRRAPDVHFLLVGARFSQKDESVLLEERARQTVRQAGVEAQVHWLGYRHDVPELLNELDVLAHPARQEPLGRVLLEAAASGVPVVATDVGGTREIFAPDRPGQPPAAQLVPPDDPTALAEAVLELRRRPDLRRRLARAARQRAVRLFSVDRAAVALADVWHELTA